MGHSRGQIPPAFSQLDLSCLPRHVAIIMDGNGRWAKARGKSRSAGHRAGMERLIEVVRTSSDIGLEVLTLYAFSTENWKRPAMEVETLFGLLVEYIRREVQALHRNNVKLRILGNWQQLPPVAVYEIERGCELTANNTGMTLCIALNYGARDEIIGAARALAQAAQAGEMDVADIDEKQFSDRLLTSGLPDPDLVIRTSGEQRLSNFLLYQVAYAEFVFTQAHWPEFTDEQYAACLREYCARERRFGLVGGDGP